MDMYMQLDIDQKDSVMILQPHKPFAEIISLHMLNWYCDSIIPWQLFKEYYN